MEFKDNIGRPCNLVTSPRDNPIYIPGIFPEGSTLVWLGIKNNEMCLDIEQAEHLAKHLTKWVLTGSLEIKNCVDCK
jgi:hypothetical protein